MSTSSSEPLLELRDLSLAFKLETQRAFTLRESFVRLVTRPWSSLRREWRLIHVARGLNIRIDAGERVGLLGINGVGKTSLCRCIAGMYAPTKGAVRVRGQVRALFDTGVGIHPELTGRENARLVVDFLYPGEPDKEALVAEALEFSELGSFVDSPYHIYSKGMQARLCLSVISSRPGDLLILDEVFDGADSSFREKVSARMMRMIEQSSAVLFVSHSFEELELVANRLIVLDDGKIVFDGKVDAGVKHYKKLIGASA